MKTYAFAVLLFFGCQCSTFDEITPSVIDRGVARRVIVNQAEYQCGGVIYATGIVLTAAHCVDEDAAITVEGHHAEKILVDEANDLAALRTETANLPALRVAQHVRIGDHVITVGEEDGEGYVYNPYVSFGRVAAITGDAIAIETIAAPGWSGTACYNARGELVGLGRDYHFLHEGLLFEILFPSYHNPEVLRAFVSRL